MKDTHSADRQNRAKDILSKHGYGNMKSVADKEVRKGVGQHEDHEHGGKKTKLKLKDGGKAKGDKPKHRLDRKPRAAGGRNKGKTPRVSVNVINAGSKPAMMPPPSAPRPPMPAPQAPMSPPPGAVPTGARPPMPPPGGMPQRPFKAGGPVKNKMDIPHLEGGSGGALGRLEKASHEKSRKKAMK